MVNKKFVVGEEVFVADVMQRFEGINIISLDPKHFERIIAEALVDAAPHIVGYPVFADFMRVFCEIALVERISIQFGWSILHGWTDCCSVTVEGTHQSGAFTGGDCTKVVQRREREASKTQQSNANRRNRHRLVKRCADLNTKRFGPGFERL